MRERLPSRRRGETREMWHSNKCYAVTAGYYRDGRLGELFISPDKASANDLTHICLEASTVCSLALQHGASLDEIRAALPSDSNGRAAGVLGAALDAIRSAE